MLRRSQAILSAATFFLMLICTVQKVSAQGPNADFQADDTIVCVGNTINFTDLSIAGSAAITAWSWNFGDGGVSAIQNPSYAYAIGGNYSVRLIVTDGNGAQDTVIHDIYVLVAQVVQSTIRICSPLNTATLIAVDPGISGVSGTWFTAGSAIIASPGNDTTTVSNLISGTYLFFWVVSDGSCSDADQVTVSVDQPVTTNAGPDQQVCSSTGTATMAASNPTPGTGLWTTSSAATITTPASRTSTITGLTIAGVYTFIWTTTNGSCIARDTMLITVSSPLTPNAGPDQTACLSPGTATLAALTPSPGTGLWTTTSAAIITNPTSINATVSGLTVGTNTFIWTVTNGACITRDTMLIVVGTPITANAGADIQVCTSTGTGTLNGNNPTPGTGLWTALSGGIITSPTSFSTTVTGLGVAGFYSFVWTITNGACVSRDTMVMIVRAPIVANAGIDQQFCATSTTTLTGNSPAPGAALWTTTSISTIATPASATTAVSNIPYGSNVFVYRITYGACVTRDTVIVRRDSLITASAGPDQQICETTTTAILAANNPNPGTGLWTKLNGGTITTPTAFNTTITALTAGTHSFVWTITNGTCVTSDTMSIVVNIQIPSNAGLDLQICQGSTTTLSGNNPTPATGLWTTTSSAIIANPTSATTNVSGFTITGTYSFVWTVTNGACVLRDTVRVLVDSSITANAGPDQSFCTTSTANLSANSFAPGIGLWTSLGTATLTSTNTSNTTANNLAYGNNIFVWSITNGTCLSSDTVIIRRDSLIPVSAGPDQQVCSGIPTINLAGNSATPGTGLWTTTSAAVITTPSSASTTVSNILTAGTYTFVWTITNGTCSSADTMTLIVDQNVIAAAGQDQNLCNVNSTTLAGNDPAPGTGIWTTTSTAIITTPTSATSTLTGLISGSYTIVWTITNGTCVTSDTVIINIDSLIVSSAGPDQAICLGTPVIMNANSASPGSGLWTALNGGTITTPTSPTTTITGLSSAGTYAFVWTIANGSCSSSDTITIAASDPISANAGADLILCEIFTTILDGNDPTPGVGTWTTTGTTTFLDPNDPLTTADNLSYGANVLIWSIVNGACTTSDTVIITVDLLVSADAGMDQSVCNGDTINLNAASASPGTGVWTALNGGIIDTPTDESTFISGISTAGTYNFVWSVNNASCFSTDTVTIIVSDPIPASAGTDQFLCETFTTTLAGNSPTPGLGLWTTSGAAIFVDPTDPLTSVSNLSYGSNEFIWTITNGTCITADTVIVNIDSLIIADAGIDQTICSGGNILLNANATAFGTGSWSAPDGGTITSPNSASTSITGLTLAGNYQFIWTIANGACTSTDTIVITIDSLLIANAGVDQSLCELFSTSLAGNDPIPGTGFWTTSGTAIFTDPTDPLTSISGLSYGINEFIWTITNSTCTSSDTVLISVSNLIVAAAGSDDVICAAAGNLILNANDPSPGTGLWTTNSSGIILDSSVFSTTVSGLNLTGIYEFIWTITNGACISTDTMVVTVDSNEVALAGPDQLLCESQTTTNLAGNTPTFGTGLWTTSSTAVFTDPTDPATLVSGLAIGNYQFIWTITNGTCQSADTIDIVVSQLATLADAGLDQQACENATNIILNANTPAIGSGLWSSLGAAVADNPTDPNSTVSGLIVGANGFVWTITNGGCFTSDTMYVIATPNPIADAGADQFVTAGTPVIIGGFPAGSSGVPPYTYNWNPAFSLDSDTVSNPTATLLATQLYVLTVTDSLGCYGTDTVVVYVNDPPVAVNDTISINEDSTVVIIPLINDTDPDNNIDPGSVSVVFGPFNGSASVDPLTGEITYIPNLNFNGQDSIFYTVCDSGIPVYCDTAWIFINLQPVNDVPLVMYDTASTSQDTCVTFNIFSNDSDVENSLDFTTFTIVSGPSNGTFTLDTLTGLLTYCPDSGFVGIDSLVYSLCDSGIPLPGLCDTALVIIDVIPLNHTPVAVDDSVTVCSADSALIKVLFNDFDVDLDTLSVGIVQGPFNGSAILDVNQQITYIANPGFSGLDSLSYSLCDNQIPQACDTAWVYITVHVAPQVTSLTTGIQCFGDSTGTIDITVAGNAPFTYGWNNGELSEDLDSLVAGVYTVVVTDSNSCSLVYTDSVAGPIAPLTAILGLQPVLCHNDSTGAIDLQISGGTAPYTFSWSNGELTEDIDSLIAGIYTVLITDTNGCISSVSDTIIQPDSSLIASLTGIDVYCPGDSSGSLQINVSGGTPGYTYLWNTGDTTQILSNLSAGAYSVVITDSYACMVTVLDTIQSTGVPIVFSASVIPPRCLESIYGNISLTVSGGFLPYTYLWNTGDTLSVVDSVLSGSYTVSVIDSNGCVALDTIVVADSSMLVMTNSGNNSFCVGDSVILSVPVYPNVTYAWSLNGTATGDTLTQLTVLQAGDFTVQATALCGNFTAGPLTINVNQLPLPIVSSAANIECDSVLTITASGGSAYSWTPAAMCSDPNAASTTVSPIYSTVFVVVVSDTNGCSAIDSVSVEVICDTLDVPGGFSPNGDGINDFYVIGGLSRYPDGKLQIFNRWGNLVYVKSNYDNSWNGFSNTEKIKLGDELPDGTYYYVFDPNNGESMKNGYVIIRR